jgi:signal transduction histidine kinase
VHNLNERIFPPLLRVAARLGARPIWAPVASGVALVLLIIAGTAAFLADQRTQDLAAAHREIRTLSVVLGEQMDRSLQAIQTVQTSLIERMRQQGIDSEADFVQSMAGAKVHNLLEAQIKALPYVDKVALISAAGRVINFSAYWPIPKIRVSDRDYFRALKGDPALDQFVSKPVLDRGTGARSIFLARKFTSKDGRFLGLVLGAIYVSYFEDYFHSILPDPHSTIALFRDDGVPLAAYPPVGSGGSTLFRASTGAAGTTAPKTAKGKGATSAAGRQIFATYRLGDFPVLVSVATAEAAVLARWQREAIMVGVITATAIAAIVGIMGFVVRAIERRQREASQRVERAETLLREAVESIPEGFIIYDNDDRLVMCNEAYRSLYPHTAAALVPGARFADILRHGLAHGEIAEAVGHEEEWLEERLRQHRSPANTHEQVLADGRHILAIDRRTQSGLNAGIRLDVTPLRTAEAQLHQAQKMDSIGQLSGGIAHDFNNLLGTIIGNLDLLVEGLADNTTLGTFAAEALGAALRAGELTKRLLAFARKQPLRPQTIDVGAQLSGLADLLRGMLGETITLELTVPDAPWPVIADPAQLESAIVNLVINARDAMPFGGVITITAANNVVSMGAAALARAHDGEISRGDHVIISVSDTGIGMTPEVVAKAFEPFFTTKPAGKGTGLGLSMVYGFAKQSQGHAVIDSDVGRGTTVHLYLPRAASRTNPIALSPFPCNQSVPGLQTKATARLPAGREVVLLAEDNEGLRQTTVRVLRDLGYRVIEAEDGPSALEVLRSNQPIDLLFTDVVMPNGMSGFELASEAHRLRPGLKILFASGFTEMAAHPRPRSGSEEAPLLTKPYRKDEVAWQMRLLLDAA